MEHAGPLIYLVDDDPAVQKALARLLGAAGYPTSQHSSAEDFLAAHDSAVSGCAIVDLGLPGMDGFGVQTQLGTAAIARPVVFLTGQGDVPASVRAMRAGAVDFLMKPVDAAALIAAVERALTQDREQRLLLEQRDDLAKRVSSLTRREREVLELVVAGLMNKHIADRLGAAEKTIKVHRGRMMHKMEVRTVADLVRLVGNGGLLQADKT